MEPPSLATAASSVPPPPRPTVRMLLPAMAIYGFLGVALTWVGIGSIMATRWARALLLIFSWSWLITGVCIITVMALLLPSVFGGLPIAGRHPGAPSASAVADAILTTLFVFYGFTFLVLPGIWTFFYNSRHVKATCEARHPLPGWTDACPLPVLAVVLWLAYSVLTMVIMPFTGMSVLPFFGTFLTGWPADAAFLVLGAVYFVAAWRTYRLDLLGWWLVVSVVGFYLVSSLVTFSRHDLIGMYRTMSLPASQLAQMEKLGVLRDKGVLWMALAFFIPVFGYLFYIRRYFQPRVTA
jgi:hypothetical protein